MSRILTSANLAVLIMLPLFAWAQDIPRCGFDQNMVFWDADIYHDVERKIETAASIVSRRVTMTLPVVFHVVYQNDEENISDLQIRSQVDVLNRDFAFMSENVPAIPNVFRALGGDTDIRFCLASEDPGGNPTNGITRTITGVPDIGTHQQSNGRASIHYTIYGGADAWDPNRYINIWIASMDGLLGSATFPGMANYPGEDGVVIDPDYVGAVGLASHASPFDRGHTLTHEMGHYFGLFHIWGQGAGGCAMDDFVEDTPEQETFYLNCPVYPQFSCGTSDMFMNFMDFTNDRCLALFTRGQAARMVGTLNSVRSTLLESTQACNPPDSGKIDLEGALIYHAPRGRQIIISLDVESTTHRKISVYSIDGRVVYSTEWTVGSVYWLDTDSFPAGIYVVQLESAGEKMTRKVFIPE